METKPLKKPLLERYREDAEYDDKRAADAGGGRSADADGTRPLRFPDGKTARYVPSPELKRRYPEDLAIRALDIV